MPHYKKEWHSARLAELQVLIDLVSNGTIRLREDVGKGMTDITDRSLAGWKFELEQHTKALAP